MKTLGFPKGPNKDPFAGLMDFELAEDLSARELVQIVDKIGGGEGIARLLSKLRGDPLVNSSSGAITLSKACAIDDSRVLIAFSISSTLYVKVVSINDYSLSNGNQVTVTGSFNTSPQQQIGLVKVDDNKLLISFSEVSNGLKTAVITITDTTPTVDAAVQVKTGDNYYQDLGLLETNKVIFCYQNSDSKFYSVVGSVSGTTVSLGTESTGASVSQPSSWVSVTVRDSTHFSCKIDDDAYIIHGTVADTSISLGDKEIFQAANNGYADQLISLSNEIFINKNFVGSTLNVRAIKYVLGVWTIGNSVALGVGNAATIARLDATRFFAAGCGSYGDARVGEVDAITLEITLGATSQFEATLDAPFQGAPAVYCPLATKAIVGWIGTVNGQNCVAFKACDITATTINSWGSTVEPSSTVSGADYFSYRDVAICRLRNDYFLAMFYDSGVTSRTRVLVMLSADTGTSISQQGTHDIDTTYYGGNQHVLLNLEDDKVLALYYNGLSKARVLTVLDTTVTVHAIANCPIRVNSSYGWGSELKISGSKILLTALKLEDGSWYASETYTADIDVNNEISFNLAYQWNHGEMPTSFGGLCSAFLQGSTSDGVFMPSVSLVLPFSLSVDEITFDTSKEKMFVAAAFNKRGKFVAIDSNRVLYTSPTLLFSFYVTDNIGVIKSKLDLSDETSDMDTTSFFENAAYPVEAILYNSETILQIGADATSPYNTKSIMYRLNIDGEIIEWRNLFFFDEAILFDAKYISLDHLSGNRFLISYGDSNNNTYLTSFVFNMELYQKYQNSPINYFGILQESGKMGYRKRVAKEGETSIGHTAAPGQKYYIDYNDGALTLTPTEGVLNIVAAVGKNNSSLVITNIHEGLTVARQALWVADLDPDYFTFTNGILIKKETS